MSAENPFDLIPMDFFNAVPGMSREQIRGELAKVAMDTEALKVAQKADVDLQERKEAVKAVAKPYTDKLKDAEEKLKVLSKLVALKVAGIPDDAIKGAMANISMDVEDTRDEMEEDQQLKEAKETAKDANEQYATGFKVNRQKVRYMKVVLSDKGA